MEYQKPTIIGHVNFVLADGIYALLPLDIMSHSTCTGTCFPLVYLNHCWKSKSDTTINGVNNLFLDWQILLLWSVTKAVLAMCWQLHLLRLASNHLIIPPHIRHCCSSASLGRVCRVTYTADIEQSVVFTLPGLSSNVARAVNSQNRFQRFDVKMAACFQDVYVTYISLTNH